MDSVGICCPKCHWELDDMSHSKCTCGTSWYKRSEAGLDLGSADRLIFEDQNAVVGNPRVF